MENSTTCIEIEMSVLSQTAKKKKKKKQLVT